MCHFTLLSIIGFLILVHPMAAQAAECAPDSFWGEYQCVYLDRGTSEIDTSGGQSIERGTESTYIRPEYRTSCPAIMPDPNQCNIYTCDEYTGTYQVSSKVCGKNEVCEESSGNCVTTCTTYSTPGLYYVKECDRIVGPSFTYTIEAIDEAYDKVHIKRQVDFGFGNKYQDVRYFTKPTSATNAFDYPFDGSFGSNIRVGDSFFDEGSGNLAIGPVAPLIYAPDCKDIFQYCQNLTDKSPMVLYCHSVCQPNPLFDHTIFAETQNVRVSMPKVAGQNYSKALNLAAQVAQNCYQKLSTLFGVDTVAPLNLAYSISQKMGNGCGMGGYHNNVLCFVSQINEDTVIEQDPKYAVYLKKASDGVCLNDTGAIFGGIPHEMTHMFVEMAFNVLQSEGIASFAEVEISQNSNGLPPFVKCLQDGYIAGYGNNPKTPYIPIEFSTYTTGVCLFRDLRETYGDEVFHKLFQSLRYVKAGKSMFAGYINPFVGEDYFSKLKIKYINMVDVDPPTYGSVQYFFD